jgi:hypothetical protein
MFYWIVQGKSLNPVELDIYKENELEWFNKVARLGWTALPDFNRKQVKILLRFSAKTQSLNTCISEIIQHIPSLQVKIIFSV